MLFRSFVISDGARSLDVYSVLPFPHATAMVIAYLPEEGIVVNADMYRPPDRGSDMPRANSSIRALLQTIDDNALDVDRHVGLHGGIGPHADLLTIAGSETATN